MLLVSNSVRLRHQATELRRDVRRSHQSKGVKVIPPRKRFNLDEQWRLNAACKHEVTVHPTAPSGQLRERHPDLEGDSCAFRKHDDGTVLPQGRQELVEDLADDWWLALEMRLEVVAATRM
jgi:hypothetical protein